MYQNYVQLNNLLDSKVGTMVFVICFIVLIFVAGLFLGRIMRIKKLEDRWNKVLLECQKEYQKVINEILEKEINLRKGG